MLSIIVVIRCTYYIFIEIPWTWSASTSPRRSLIRKDLCSCIIAVGEAARPRWLIINRNYSRTDEPTLMRTIKHDGSILYMSKHSHRETRCSCYYTDARYRSDRHRWSSRMTGNVLEPRYRRCPRRRYRTSFARAREANMRRWRRDARKLTRGRVTGGWRKRASAYLPVPSP